MAAGVLAFALAMLAHPVVAAVVAVPDVVADVVAEGPRLIRPQTRSPLQLAIGSAHPLQLQTRTLFSPLQLEIRYRWGSSMRLVCRYLQPHCS